eukprot:PhF_6_TR37673/c0_g1_i1/m.56065/K07112/K07112; uncharacterized protein
MPSRWLQLLSLQVKKCGESNRLSLNDSSVWHQFSFVLVGLTLGGYLAQVNDQFPSVKKSDLGSHEYLLHFLGGVFMLFGGKMARGCTCGRGVTGFSELSVPSIVGTVGIFAGAIATAFLRVEAQI